MLRVCRMAHPVEPRREAGSAPSVARLSLRGEDPFGDVVAPEVGGAEIAERDLGGFVPGLAHEVGEPGALVAGGGGEAGAQASGRSSSPGRARRPRPRSSPAGRPPCRTARCRRAGRPCSCRRTAAARRAPRPRSTGRCLAPVSRSASQRSSAAAGQARGSAGLAQIATCWPRPCWSVLERRTSTVRPRPGTSWTSPMRSATSSERRSAAPKPSSSMARLRIPSGRLGRGEGGQHLLSTSGTAGAACRVGRTPRLRTTPSSVRRKRGWLRSSAHAGEQVGAVRIAASATRIEETASPSSARRRRTWRPARGRRTAARGRGRGTTRKMGPGGSVCAPVPAPRARTA